MKRKNTTRNALVTSIISLLLCVAMLVGTTFAWFTDSVTSGINTIAAGNLDVELYNSIGIEEDKKVSESTPLFEEVKLWEPGVVAYENLTVANVGTLALKYQMTMNITGENTVAGTNYKLSDVLKIAVVEGGVKGATREAVLQEVADSGASWETLKTKALSGDLEAKTNAEPVGLVIYWQPTANDNNWNLNNGKITSNGAETLQITLGINLFATQLESESDSFDKTYDKDAVLEIPEVKVETPTADALLAALEAGETAKLTGDLTLDGDAVIPDDITSAIDLNGHTLTVGNNEVVVEGNLIVTATNGGSMVVEATGDEYDDLYAPFFVQDGGHLFIESGDIVVNSGAGVILYGNADFTMTGGSITASNGTNAVVAVSTNSDIDLLGGAITAAEPGSALYLQVCNTNVVLNGTALNGKIYQMGGDLVLTYYGATAPNVVEDTMQYTQTINQIVSNSEQLAAAIANASADEETVIHLASGTYADDINLTLAAIGSQKGDLVFKAATGANPVITGKVTLGYYAAGTGVAEWNANVTFEGITFDQAKSETHSLNVQSVESVTLKNCKIIGDGEYGIESPRGNNTGKSFVTGCTFENAAMQILGNFGTGLVIEQSIFNNSRINVQGGNGVTVQNCTFNDTVTDANNNESFYLIRSNSTPITVIGGMYNVDSTITGVGVAGSKGWGVFVNRGTTNWTVSDAQVILTDAALAQPALKVTNCLSTGKINTSNVTLNSDPYVTSADEVKNVVANGATNLYLADGEYDVYGCGGKTLTLTGSKNAVLKVMNEGEDGCDYGFGDSAGVGNITFNGLTIDTTANTGNYKGYAYMKGTFNDCNFVGAYSLNNANDFVFNRCTFDFKNGYFWTWGAESVTFDGCTFNGNSKAILAHGSASTVININNCNFAATEKGYTSSGDNTAVVEMDPVASNTYTINFTGENTNTDAYAGWTRVKDGTTGHIINGLN